MNEEGGYDSYSVIAIDEAQFFPDLVEFASYEADIGKKTVIVAGLNGDFRRQKIGQVLDLISHADIVLKLFARCTSCQNEGLTTPAIFSSRTTLETSQEVVGGSDKYVSLCRFHYQKSTKDSLSENNFAATTILT
eukprot:CAMPEP_0175056044 /NCGR_PEP_ID=MMETSP0052_2-20121109/10438_1 /TAXON_ID=51329 ORGANISM="Polytomella parva, Strain SAG 63-3" /NCGR_SAMPLE_ID=MMETSP0052_2 /ASSEMBLY_ACC=CAM_ASM_000194 /LENGTH=134 /DNA_ID=CAMNT_0016320999 /DNA_START=436 /DNA_END=836 /DNA_ORIENTATION=-